MMPTGKVLFTTGAYGTTVSVVKRPKGSLVLRYTKGGTQTDKALGHQDLAEAKLQAKDLSLQLANVRATESGAPGAYRRLTVDGLFANYTREVSKYKQGHQPDEDARRRRMFLAVLGPKTLASKVNAANVAQFIQRRRRGDIVVEGLNLRKHVKPSTIDADVVWLQSVFNWAVSAGIFAVSPIKGAKRPDVGEQLRPMATAERAAKVLAVAHKVHPLFPLLFTAVRTLGWRISAVCGIDGTDIRRTPTALAPHGEIRKNWRKDKESQHQWLPMPRLLREALDAAGVLGVAGPIFPSQLDPDRPMSRTYARDLLERAEGLAKLDALEGGDWHPYRRLWATERKGLPVADVANAGAWSDQRTVQKYQQLDPQTTADVMLFEPPVKNETGATSGTRSRKRAKGA